ncbi:ATP-dependent helicase [Rhizobium sp. RMa-01]|uniref:UvrD-helicase domain-containing protein n=1 Tax=unclassified Rhizobium TaxID=2613769 RepID=UPI0008DA8827|nr:MULTISPECIES: UvrD-helicase domain-containing protein [unclassified Rhizobium]OHV19413.1 DNA/RNA helicase [Rhizobium sp. RSm-3]RVU09836.1 ATP-dependent helicase [Rhizobium sp. RMa-01]
MDQAGIGIEPEVEAILEHVRAGRSFLLSGGAGSGKTYSLVQVIGELLRTDPSATVACITYTNAAVHEIESRVSGERLSVSTIHDFLWGAIGSFQAELKTVLIDLLGGETPKIKPGSTIVAPEMFDGKPIQYKEYKILGEGIISHDEIIAVAHGLFAEYPKLRDIVRDRFPYILVDEYQDTAPEVIEILLGFLAQSPRKGVCGFFGDSMQAIYDEGVGDIRKCVEKGEVFEVKKEQNRRNPRLVFELANRLRNDGIVQRASEDKTAPNMADGKLKDGAIRFYYTTGAGKALQDVRDRLAWDFTDIHETKELNLTHNLIAPHAGFGDLMAIYDKDGVLSFRDRIVEFIKKNDDLSKFDGITFGEVVDALQAGKEGKRLKAVSPTDGMQLFIDANPQLLADARGRNFLQFRRMFVDKDLLIDDKKQSEEDLARKGSKRCELVKHVFRIQEVVHLYKQGRYNEFLRKTEFKLTQAADKVRLRERIEKISGMADRPVLEVIEYADAHGLCRIDDRYTDFRAKKAYLFERLKDVPYSSFQSLYEYLEGRTGYSTQHKIKGREFDRVLVVMDTGDWNKYSFKYLFEGEGTESVLARTRKLFYVCCTRAKEVLAVYYDQPSAKALEQALAWFGADNCEEL